MTTISQRELITRTLANDREPTQGYILEELARLTFISTQKCREVAEAFLKPLTATSARTSAKTIHRVIKALRALRYICEKGNGQFRELLQPSVSVIKFYTTFNIPERDPVHGDAFIQQVRKEAQKCVAVLYEDQFLSNAVATQGAASACDGQISARRTATSALYHYDGHGALLDSANPNKYSVSKFYVYNDETGEPNCQGHGSSRLTPKRGSERDAQHRDATTACGAAASFSRSTPESISSSMAGSRVIGPRSRKIEGFGNPYFCKEDGPKSNGGYSASNMSTQFSSDTFRNRIMSMATSATGESGASLATVVNSSTENIVSGFSHAVSAVGKYMPQPVREKLDAVIGNNPLPQQQQQGRFSSSVLFPSTLASRYDSFPSQTASSTSSSVGVVDFSNRFRFSGQPVSLSTSSPVAAGDPAMLWAVRSKAADSVSESMVPSIAEPRKALVSQKGGVDNEPTVSMTDNTTTETAARIVLTTLINGVCENPSLSPFIIEDFVRRSYRYPHPEHVVVGILDQLFPTSSPQWQGGQNEAFVGIPSWSRRHKLLTLLLALLADDVCLNSIINAASEIQEAQHSLAQAKDQRAFFAASIRTVAADVLGRLKKQAPRSSKLVDEILQVAERFARSPALEPSKLSPRNITVCDPSPIEQPPPDLLDDFEDTPPVLAEAQPNSHNIRECPDLLEYSPQLDAANGVPVLSSFLSAPAAGKDKAADNSHRELARTAPATVTAGDLLLDMNFSNTEQVDAAESLETPGCLTAMGTTVSFTAPSANAPRDTESRPHQKRDPPAPRRGSLFSGLQVITPTEETLNEFLAVSPYPKSAPSGSAVTVHDILDLEKSSSLNASSRGVNAVADTFPQAKPSSSHANTSLASTGVSATTGFPFTAPTEPQAPNGQSGFLGVEDELVWCKTQQCTTVPLDMTVQGGSLGKKRFTEPELRSSCFNFVK